MIKQKFTEYLTQGIDIHIPDDEVETFYKMITKFINSAENNFEAYFMELDGYVLICDKFTDYLKFKYEDDKIIIMHAHPNSEHYYDSEFALKMGLAFIGVVVFIESFAPSEVGSFIAKNHYDQWQI